MISKQVGILLALACLVGFPVAGTAQLAGSVVDSGDRPLGGVVVRAWGTGEILSTVETDAAGRFILAVNPDLVRRLTAHFAGAPTTFVHDLEPPIRIEVPTQPVEIEGIDAGGTREVCALPDDPQARALLSAAVAGLSRETGMRGLGWSPRRRSATVPTPRLPADVKFSLPAEAPTDFVDAWSSLNGGTWGYLGIPRHLAPSSRGTFEYRARVAGYGPFDPLVDGANPFQYPRLHGPKAYHFGTPTFAEGHDLAVLSRDGSETVIEFCPRSDQASIRGRLYVRDGDLTAAEWTFIDADGNSVDAGGSVEFRVVADRGGQRHLLARLGRRWFPSLERLGFYDVEETDYRFWQISPTAEAPLSSDVRR